MISFFSSEKYLYSSRCININRDRDRALRLLWKNFSISFPLRNEAETQNGKLEGARCTEQKTLEDKRKENKFSPHSS